MVIENINEKVEGVAYEQLVEDVIIPQQLLKTRRMKKRVRKQSLIEEENQEEDYNAVDDFFWLYLKI